MSIAGANVDIKAELKRIRQQGAFSFLVGAVILGWSVIWLPRLLAFPVDLSERLAFALRADLFVLVWLLIGIGMVSTVRRRSAEDSRGAAYGPPSARLAVPAAFLQNTLEQVFATTLAFLALATVEGEAPLAFIVASLPIFALGRVTFLHGYPGGAGARAFGMVTTALPSLGAFCWVIYDLAARSPQLWK